MISGTLSRICFKAVDDLNLPESYFCFYDAVAAFDHLENHTFVISTGFPETEETKRRERVDLVKRIEKYGLTCPRPSPPAGGAKLQKKLVLKSNFSHENYLKAVATAFR